MKTKIIMSIICMLLFMAGPVLANGDGYEKLEVIGLFRVVEIIPSGKGILLTIVNKNCSYIIDDERTDTYYEVGDFVTAIMKFNYLGQQEYRLIDVKLK